MCEGAGEAVVLPKARDRRVWRLRSRTSTALVAGRSVAPRRGQSGLDTQRWGSMSQALWPKPERTLSNARCGRITRTTSDEFVACYTESRGHRGCRRGCPHERSRGSARALRRHLRLYDLSAEIVSRVRVGAYVVDEERVTGFPGGEVHAVIIYRLTVMAQSIASVSCAEADPSKPRPICVMGLVRTAQLSGRSVLSVGGGRSTDRWLLARA